MFNPRTYTQIHTPTVVQGWGLMKPLLRVFDMLQYFETILPSVESLWCSQQDELYFSWVVALLEACGVTNSGRHLGRHLGFYQELEIRLKPQEMVIVFAWHVNNDVNNTWISILHHVIHNLYFYFWKKLRKHAFSLKNGLATCYLWRHNS